MSTTPAALQESADDLFLRLGSQSFFQAVLINLAGQSGNASSTPRSEAADDLMTRLGSQRFFKATLLPAGSGRSADSAVLTADTTLTADRG